MRQPSASGCKGPIIGLEILRSGEFAAALARASVAFAQAAEQPDAKPSSAASAGEKPAGSERQRKKWNRWSSSARARPNALRSSARRRAATAVDSIAAEDVGKFPDQNVSEAISRVAGVALDRGENGEGVGISVRGNGMELTRVGIDGMTVLNTSGSLAGGAQAGIGGRAADLRELPSAIIKTIDVFKGTTAAMTEGSLGGSVQIETRNGLDFDKPFFQFATDGQQNSITEKLTPSGSAIFANKFMDDRLGIFASVNYSQFETQTDLQQPQTSGNSGPFRNADFDQSPEKTFTYDPSIVDPTATAGNFRVPTSNYSSLSPIDIITRSAAAQTPADCLTSFPALRSGDIEHYSGGRADPGYCHHTECFPSEQPHRGAAGADEWTADLPEPMERLRTFAHSFAPAHIRGGKVLGPVPAGLSVDRRPGGLCRLSEGGPPRLQRRQHAQSRQPGL